MRKKVHNHLGYYVCLAAIFVLGFFAIQKTNDLEVQVMVFSLVTFFYVLLGIIHHLLNHRLNAKIMIEYVLIGSLGLSIMFFMLKGGLGI